jgi:5-methylcytosine-specific restriction endonuclease McrA
MSKNWRNSTEYHKWRNSVINRDKKCVICGATEHLTAHHMNHDSYFKDQRFDVNNGVTLCSKCHMNFHNNFKRSYRQKCTKYDFDNFKVLAEYFKDIFSKKE